MKPMELIAKKFEELTRDEIYEIARARQAVFVVEQNCPYQDLDGLDKFAWHLFLRENSEIKAYLRIFPRGVVGDEASIGRVLSRERGRGFGERIFAAGLDFATQKLGETKIRLAAQCQAKAFYEKFGFKQISPEFLEDGIPHVEMLREC